MRRMTYQLNADIDSSLIRKPALANLKYSLQIVAVLAKGDEFTFFEGPIGGEGGEAFLLVASIQ